MFSTVTAGSSAHSLPSRVRSAAPGGMGQDPGLVKTETRAQTVGQPIVSAQELAIKLGGPITHNRGMRSKLLALLPFSERGQFAGGPKHEIRQAMLDARLDAFLRGMPPDPDTVTAVRSAAAAVIDTGSRSERMQEMARTYAMRKCATPAGLGYEQGRFKGANTSLRGDLLRTLQGGTYLLRNRLSREERARLGARHPDLQLKKHDELYRREHQDGWVTVHPVQSLDDDRSFYAGKITCADLDTPLQQEAIEAQRIINEHAGTEYPQLGETASGEQWTCSVSRLGNIDGCQLQQVLANPIIPSDQKDGLVFPFVKGLVERVRALHAAGIYHRDLKTANVVILPDGKVDLIDFYDSTQEAEHVLAPGGRLRGTPGYMKPLPPGATVRSADLDLFSLGSIFIELSNGTFNAPDFSGYQEQDIAAFRGHVLAHSPADRNDLLKLLGMRLTCDNPGLRPSLETIFLDPYFTGRDPAQFQNCEQTFLRNWKRLQRENRALIAAMQATA